MVDYSKWKDIEISDDEDDTHPNIDKASLFRWRHQARLERMEELEKDKQEFNARKGSYQARLNAVKEKISKNDGDVEDLQKKLKELEVEGQQYSKKEEELRLKEKKTPWNVDTISKPGFQKTVINKKPERQSDDDLPEEEKVKKMNEFFKTNEKLIKQFGMLRKYDDSKKFLSDNTHLVNDSTANYLVIWCINLEMEKKTDLMSHIAHQCICLQYILELGKQLDVDPRACITSFFVKIQDCVPEYKAEFEREIRDFITRIKNRAEEKIQEAIAEDEEERQARLGPGGLDPADVFEELPEELKKCFESRDKKLLQETIAKLPEDQAKYYMKRCVCSGLWVPDANKSGEGDEEEVYAEAEASEPTNSSGGVKDIDLD